MKALVVYYSLGGSTELIARKISRMLGADLFKLELEIKPCTTGYLRLFVIAKQVYLKEKPKLSSWPLTLEGYDTIFLGSPIWMGTMAPAMRSYIDIADLSEKTVIPFCTYEASIERYFKDLERSCPIVNFSLGMGFSFPKEGDSGALDEQIRVWLNNVKEGK